ncbi:MAG: hypothetical protein M1825_002289 [Sarcosagium campestre]|nr:MAG: hypothetical protein M1825_002289 [Sarcosagium campestre]
MKLNCAGRNPLLNSHLPNNILTGFSCRTSRFCPSPPLVDRRNSRTFIQCTPRFSDPSFSRFFKSPDEEEIIPPPALDQLRKIEDSVAASASKRRPPSPDPNDQYPAKPRTHFKKKPNIPKPNPPKFRPNGKRIRLTLDKEDIDFDNVFLRDACSCPLCVDPSTQQKLFQTSDIPSSISAKSSKFTPADGLTIRWKDDLIGYPEDHTTVIPTDFLRAYANPIARYQRRHQHFDERVLWNRDIMESDVENLPYEGYMNDDSVLLTALRQLRIYGLVFLKDVPQSDEQAVERIALRIGALKDTFYGRTWDVKSVAEAKNVAYTHQSLGLHMDLLYFQQPPQLQLLHCIRNSATGGNSIFSDAFRAAQYVRMSSASLFAALSSFPVSYHYRNAGQHYHYIRPTFELEPTARSDLKPRVVAVNWSPPFQAPCDVHTGTGDGGRLRAYLTGAKLFADRAETVESLYERRLAEGECVLFDNRRVLHGRRAFDVDSGERWLKGAYVDADAWWSRLRVLGEKLGGKPSRHRRSLSSSHLE